MGFKYVYFLSRIFFYPNGRGTPTYFLPKKDPKTHYKFMVQIHSSKSAFSERLAFNVTNNNFSLKAIFHLFMQLEVWLKMIFFL